MKIKTICLLFILLAGRLCSQSYLSYDTIRKNEFSASFLPLLVVFSGYDPSGRYGTFNFSYKHYNKNKTVFRSAFVFGPSWYILSPINNERYERTVDTLDIFSSHSVVANQKYQLNIGFEKIFKVNRLLHGLGVEAYVNRQVYAYRNTYYWYPVYLGNNMEELWKYSPNRSFPGKIYNGIDSLTSEYDVTRLGIGLQIFYTLRYQINKYFYLSTTMGPYLTMIKNSYTHINGNKNLYKVYPGPVFDAMILVFDLSLAFRF